MNFIIFPGTSDPFCKKGNIQILKEDIQILKSESEKRGFENIQVVLYPGHRRVGRFVAGAFHCSEKGKSASLSQILRFPQGKEENLRKPNGAGLDGLHYRNYLCPATE